MIIEVAFPKRLATNSLLFVYYFPLIKTNTRNKGFSNLVVQ